MLKIQSLQTLIEALSKLPSIGPKSAERLAYYILKADAQKVEHLAQSLIRVKAEVHLCERCFNYTESQLCYFCESSDRQNKTLCVVKEPSAIERIEQAGVFKGRYHVLHGAIAPLMGITPDKLKIKELIQRINQSQQNPEEAIEEIIFALDADLEGDTTILYLTQQLEGYSLKLSRLAQGVPIGSGMDYLDERTLGRALQNRVEIDAHSRFDRS